MSLTIDANDALPILIEMTAETIATNRLLIDLFAEMKEPDDETEQTLLKAFYHRKVAEARIAILHKIYEHRGKVNLDDIGLGENHPKE